MRLLLVSLALLGMLILGIVALTEVNEDDPKYADGEAITVVKDWVHKGDDNSSYGAQVLAQTTDGLWREDYLGGGKWLVSRSISWETGNINESINDSGTRAEIGEKLQEYTFDLSIEDRQSFLEGLWEGYSKPLSLLRQPDIEWYVYETTGLVVLKSPLSPDDILSNAEESTLAALFLSGSFQVEVVQQIEAFTIPNTSLQIKSLNVYLEPSDPDQVRGNLIVMNKDVVENLDLVILDKEGCINGVSWSEFQLTQPWFTISQENFVNSVWTQLVWMALENPGENSIALTDIADNLEGLPGEEIDEVPCYHLRGDVVAASLPYLTSDAAIDLWIGVQDFVVRQLDISTESANTILTQKFVYYDGELDITVCQTN